jgi:hypothetical protein
VRRGTPSDANHLPERNESPQEKATWQPPRYTREMKTRQKLCNTFAFVSLLCSPVISCQTDEPDKQSKNGSGTSSTGSRTDGSDAGGSSTGGTDEGPSGGGSSIGGNSGNVGGTEGTEVGGSPQTGDGGMGGADTSGSGGESSSGQVGIFVAVGHQGRTIMSCDRGQTWINNRSYDTDGGPESCGETTPVTCWQSACTFLNEETCEEVIECDCDHHPGRSMGVAAGSSAFVAAWGWGPPGALKSSLDGVTWEVPDASVDQKTFAGVAHGNGVFVALDRAVRVSPNGTDWVDGGNVGFSPLVRSIGFSASGGGVFVAGGSDSGGDSALAISRDNGGAWTVPAGSSECGGDFSGVAGQGEVIVIVFESKACRSTDGGDSFELSNLEGGVDVFFDGSSFVSFRGSNRYRSEDGMDWEEEALTINGLPDGHRFQLGRIGVADDGSLVSVRGEWDTWYENQDFYRSSDGITWQVLPAADFVGSHPIRDIAFGFVDAAACE